MSHLNQDDVLFILKLLEESKFDELHLETEDFKLQAKKHPKEGKQPELDFQYEKHTPPLEPNANESQSQDLQSPKAKSFEPPGPKAKTAHPSLVVPEGLATITAPMLGTFYRTPKVGAPPFVDVGAWVKEDDPVCIIELMKLSSTVEAGIRGRIVQICADQGQMVEFNQTLFLVEKVSEEEEPPKPAPNGEYGQDERDHLY